MLESRSYEDIKNEILSNINLPIAKNEGSVLNSLVSGTSLMHATIYNLLQEILNDAFIKTATGNELDLRIEEFGIARKTGKIASGMVTIKGLEGTKVVSGSKIITGDRIYEVLQEGVNELIIKGDKTLKAYVQAVEPGTSYNQPAMTAFTMVDHIDGIDEIVTEDGIVGGLDVESDDEYKERFFYVQAHKGTSGNVDDYINWGYSVDGVKRVRVIPLWNGNGTVKVVVSGDNNAKLSDQILSDVKDFINSKKPIGASVTIITPSEKAINISVSVVLEKGYTEAGVKKAITYNIEEYFAGASKILYPKVMAAVANTEGVQAVSSLSINGRDRNVTLTEDEVATVGSVTVNIVSSDSYDPR